MVDKYNSMLVTYLDPLQYECWLQKNHICTVLIHQIETSDTFGKKPNAIWSMIYKRAIYLLKHLKSCKMFTNNICPLFSKKQSVRLLSWLNIEKANANLKHQAKHVNFSNNPNQHLFLTLKPIYSIYFTSQQTLL